MPRTGDVRKGFPQEMRQELSLEEISQAVEGLQRREDVGAQGADSRMHLSRVGSRHVWLPHQCSSGRYLPEVTSDFSGSHGYLNLFIFHSLTRAVIAAAHCLVHELSYLFRRLLPSGPFSDFLTLLPFLHTDLLSVVLFPGSPDPSPLLFTISIGHFIHMTFPGI